MFYLYSTNRVSSTLALVVKTSANSKYLVGAVGETSTRAAAVATCVILASFYPDIVNSTEVMPDTTTVATDETTDQEGTVANTIGIGM